MTKTVKAAAAAVVVLAGLAGCGLVARTPPATDTPTSSNVDVPNTRPAPIATSPTSSSLDHINWVVESSIMGRDVDGERFSVICVPADELGIAPTKQTHVREVQTDKATSYGAVAGSPCPAGPILTEW